MDEHEKAGKCKWVALGFTVLLLQGLLPISFIGGFAGLKTGELFSSYYLLDRSLVLVGMVLAVFVASILAMLLLAGINKLSAVLFFPPAFRLTLKRKRED